MENDQEQEPSFFLWKGITFYKKDPRAPGESYACNDPQALVFRLSNREWGAVFPSAPTGFGWTKEEALEQALQNKIRSLSDQLARFEALRLAKP